MTEPADLLGRRVTVRYRIDEPGHSTTDVVGRVLHADAASLLVERRDGTQVTVRVADVVLQKVIPDRPRRSRRATSISVEDLTRVTSLGWPAPDRESLGDWELRAAGGFTGRANSVAVVGDPGVALPAALARVTGFYAARGLPPRAQVVADSAWERRFRDAGWEPEPGYRGGAIVQVADLAEAHPSDARVRFGATADATWLDLYERVEDVDAARAVLQGPGTVGFAELVEGGETVAVGRVVVSGAWAGISAVQTRDDQQRRGLARAVVSSCLSWAIGHGATTAYLQTMPDNHAALALYAPFGFTTHHAYRYLRPSP